MFSHLEVKLETDRPQQPATGYREATIVVEGRLSLDRANRACSALMSLRPSSESRVAAQLKSGVRLYFRYYGEQIPAADIESAVRRAL